MLHDVDHAIDERFPYLHQYSPTVSQALSVYDFAQPIETLKENSISNSAVTSHKNTSTFPQNTHHHLFSTLTLPSPNKKLPLKMLGIIHCIYAKLR